MARIPLCTYSRPRQMLRWETRFAIIYWKHFLKLIVPDWARNRKLFDIVFQDTALSKYILMEKLRHRQSREVIWFVFPDNYFKLGKFKVFVSKLFNLKRLLPYIIAYIKKIPNHQNNFTGACVSEFIWKKNCVRAPKLYSHRACSTIQKPSWTWTTTCVNEFIGKQIYCVYHLEHQSRTVIVSTPEINAYVVCTTFGACFNEPDVTSNVKFLINLRFDRKWELRWPYLYPKHHYAFRCPFLTLLCLSWLKLLADCR